MMVRVVRSLMTQNSRHSVSILPHLKPFTNKALRSAPQSHRTFGDKPSVASPNRTLTVSRSDDAGVVP